MARGTMAPSLRSKFSLANYYFFPIILFEYVESFIVGGMLINIGLIRR
jgi:hypothetical protein